MDVILNADDFGFSPGVNEAVKRACQSGVLTSASLMVTGEACADAVAFARQNPQLSVGLHLVLTEGRSLQPPERIPHLVSAAGYFPSNPAWAGLKYFLSPACRRELLLEIKAQVERFAETGLPFSHIDGHQNIHVHPTIFAMLLPLAEQYGAAGIRLPRVNLPLEMHYTRRNLGNQLLWTAVFGLLSDWNLRKLKSHPIKTTRRVYGLVQSGQMNEDYLLYLLQHINAPTVEVYFHPSTSYEIRLGPNRDDLAALVSPNVRRVIRERHIHLCNYLSLDHQREHK